MIHGQVVSELVREECHEGGGAYGYLLDVAEESVDEGSHEWRIETELEVKRRRRMGQKMALCMVFLFIYIFNYSH